MVLKKISGIMWERHKNPWSGYTRYMIFFGTMVAIWAHSELWLTLMILAILTNPFWFPPPKHNRAWMTRAVIGETIWLRTAGPLEKYSMVFSGTILAFLLIWTLWTHRLVPSIILAVIATSYKTFYLCYTAKLAKEDEERATEF